MMRIVYGLALSAALALGGAFAVSAQEAAEEQPPAAAEGATQQGQMQQGMQGRGMGMGMGPGPGAGTGMGHHGMMCPFMAPETDMSVENTANGVRIELTAQDPQVVSRLQKQAEIMRLMRELHTQGQ